MTLCEGTRQPSNLQDKSNNGETFNIFSNISGLSFTRQGGMLVQPVTVGLYKVSGWSNIKSVQERGDTNMAEIDETVVKHFPESSAKWRESLFSV